MRSFMYIKDILENLIAVCPQLRLRRPDLDRPQPGLVRQPRFVGTRTVPQPMDVGQAASVAVIAAAGQAFEHTLCHKAPNHFAAAHVQNSVVGQCCAGSPYAAAGGEGAGG